MLTKLKKWIQVLLRLLKSFLKNPNILLNVLDTVPEICSAHEFSKNYQVENQPIKPYSNSSTNPLWQYFQNNEEGHGIWKWEHYFDIYHRHLARFINTKVNILEIGIFSGGSLEMWHSYFGKDSHIYGMDIEKSCKVYENDHTSIFIGDQADRTFWKTFRENAKPIDVIIDDGGHMPDQQQITLEELLPSLKPGGVYICEDVHGSFNRFTAFAAGLASNLNNFDLTANTIPKIGTSKFQMGAYSMHFYPFVVIIEKHATAPKELASLRQGTKWQPFLNEKNQHVGVK